MTNVPQLRLQRPLPTTWLGPKPILGLMGGIGAGKSAIAKSLEALGGATINSDRDAHAVLNSPDIQAQLAARWGAEVVTPAGTTNRHAIAQRVFQNPTELAWLNSLIHPRVAALRTTAMATLAQSSAVRYIIWDTPLLLENQLHTQCDILIFIACPLAQRLARVQASRGWSAVDLASRQAQQTPLATKEDVAHIIIDNSGTPAQTTSQIAALVALLPATTKRKSQ
ncbi:MAG: dephospho-CoA kinase [Phycisphaerae bacterium]